MGPLADKLCSDQLPSAVQFLNVRDRRGRTHSGCDLDDCKRLPTRFLGRKNDRLAGFQYCQFFLADLDADSLAAWQEFI